jgi:hypothetical protein
VLHRTSGPCLPNATTSQPPTPAAPVAIFDGYVDGKPRISWTGEALRVGAKLYTSQPASLDAEYGELRARIEHARKVCMDVDLHPDSLENILDSRAQLVERVAVLEAQNKMFRGQLEYDLTKDKDFREDLARLSEQGLHRKTRSLIVKDVMQAIHVYAAAQREVGRKEAAPHPHADEAAKVEWISVDDRMPDAGVLVVVYSPPTEYDWPGYDNISFDCIDPEDDDHATWKGHNEHYEHYCCVAKGEGSVGPSADAPYTLWAPIPKLPSSPAEGKL